MIANKFNITPTKEGFFGNYGGQFITGELKNELDRIYEAFLFYKDDKERRTGQFLS